MISRFISATEGGIAVITALLMTVLIGMSGLAVELAYWYTSKGAMQATADAAVITAAMAFNAGNSSYANEAFAVAAANGWSGTTATNDPCTPGSGIKVCVNSPPQYGNFTASSAAIEVVISNQVPPVFAWAVGHGSNTGILAHAVMSAGTTGNGCLLALGSGNSIQVSGNGNLTLSGCDADGKGNIQMNGTNSRIVARSYDIAGTVSNPSQVTVSVTGKSNDSNTPADPFSSRSIGTKPSTCTNWSGTSPISPGAYCGLNISNGNITLSSGIYYIEGGCFCVSGPATVSSASGGVTIVLTSTAAAPTSFATVSITGQGNLSLSAPTSGGTAGLVFFGDPANTTNQTETFAGQGHNSVTGAFYFKNQTVALSGNGSFSSPNSCFEIVAQTITDSGNATLSDGCVGDGINPIGTTTLKLVE